MHDIDSHEFTTTSDIGQQPAARRQKETRYVPAGILPQSLREYSNGFSPAGVSERKVNDATRGKNNSVSMKITVLTSTFPKISETFVLHHVTGMLDRQVDVRVIAWGSEEEAFSNAEIEGYDLRVRTHQFYRKKKFLQRLGGLPGLLRRNIRRDRYPVLRSLNPLLFGRPAMNLKTPYLADAFAKVGRTDILHCHFGPNGVIGSYFKKLGLCKRLVVTFHGYDVSRVLKKPRHVHKYDEIFEHADLILPVSDHWRKELINLGAPADRTIVHRMGINPDYFMYRERQPHDRPLRIATTARFTEKKGLDYAVKAVAKAVEKFPDLRVHYDMIGDGPMRPEVEELIAEHGLGDRITLHGAITLDEVRVLLEKADVFLLPSVTASDGDKEGVPVSLMEAMAIGMPVISTWHSGIPELIEDGVSGCLVPERDVDALADRIGWMSENRGEWARMGRAGRKKVEEEFNLERLHDQLVALYREIS